MNDTTYLHEQPSVLTPQVLLLRAADDLALRDAGVFGKETVERRVLDSYTALAQSARHVHPTVLGVLVDLGIRPTPQQTDSKKGTS